MTQHKVLSKQDLLSLFEGKKSFISDIDSHKKALDYINANEFPTNKTEAWKNSNLNQLTKHKFCLPENKNENEVLEDTFAVFNMQPYKISIINGKYSPENSDLKLENSKIFIGSLKEAKEKHSDLFNKYYNKTESYKDNVFASLNTAFAEDGVFIYLPDNIVLEKPIHVLFFSNGREQKAFIQNRNLVVIGNNSFADILISYHSVSFDSVLTNVVSEVFLEENSNLNLNVFQGEGEGTFHINNTHFIQQKGSNLTTNSAIMCGEFVRNDLIVDLLGEYCNTSLNGFYLSEKEQHFDNYIKVNHLSANCNSNQLYKGILDNKSSASFFGKVFVARDSQKTDANQSNKNILLTDNAKVFSKPQLEIYADDVSCSHGSTTGQLDKEALFYLRSRGISERNAKTLMLYAFISDVINQINLTPYKELLYFLLNKRLKGDKIEGLCSIKICPSC
jgi:Fe-S cluster assembly protein SufD